MRRWTQFGMALLMAGGCQMADSAPTRYGIGTVGCNCLAGEVRPTSTPSGLGQATLAVAQAPSPSPPAPVYRTSSNPVEGQASGKPVSKESAPAQDRILGAELKPAAPTVRPDVLPPPTDGSGPMSQLATDQTTPALTAPPPPSWPEEPSTRAPAPTAPTAASPAATNIRLVNSKRISLNYAVQNVGSSGVTAVELWCTRDGRTWTKRATYPKAQPPCVIDVEDEDLYGFTIVVRNGVGLGKTPQEGDRPQVWVEVDTTKPFVRLMGVEAEPGAQGRNLTILWKATDKNLGPRPVSLRYAAKAEGPWTVIATDLENTGRYVWHLPSAAPHHLFLRVEAVDLVGNVGIAQTPTPLLDDLSQPTTAILAVEGKGK